MIAGVKDNSISFNGYVFIKKTPFNFNEGFLPTSVIQKVKNQNLLGELTNDFVELENKRKGLNLTGKSTVYKEYENTEEHGLRKELLKKTTEIRKKLTQKGFIDKKGNWEVKGIPLKNIFIAPPQKSTKGGENMDISHVNAFNINHQGGEVDVLDGAHIKVNKDAIINEKIEGSQISLIDYNSSAKVKGKKVTLLGNSVLTKAEGGTVELYNNAEVSHSNFKNIVAKGQSYTHDMKTETYKGSDNSTGNNLVIKGRKKRKPSDGLYDTELKGYAKLQNSTVNKAHFKKNSSGTNLRFNTLDATNDTAITNSKGKTASFIANANPKGVIAKKLTANSLIKKLKNRFHSIKWQRQILASMPKEKRILAHKIKSNSKKNNTKIMQNISIKDKIKSAFTKKKKVHHEQIAVRSHN